MLTDLENVQFWGKAKHIPSVSLSLTDPSLLPWSSGTHDLVLSFVKSTWMIQFATSVCDLLTQSALGCRFSYPRTMSFLTVISLNKAHQ